MCEAAKPLGYILQHFSLGVNAPGLFLFPAETKIPNDWDFERNAMRSKEDVDRIERAALLRYAEEKLKVMTLDELREIVRQMVQMGR